MTMELWIVILVAASLLLNVVTLILVIGLIRRNNAGAQAGAGPLSTAAASNSGTSSGSDLGGADSGVVFCRSCGSQFDSKLNACPACGTTR